MEINYGHTVDVDKIRDTLNREPRRCDGAKFRQFADAFDPAAGQAGSYRRAAVGNCDQALRQTISSVRTAPCRLSARKSARNWSETGAGICWCPSHLDLPGAAFRMEVRGLRDHRNLHDVVIIRLLRVSFNGNFHCRYSRRAPLYGYSVNESVVYSIGSAEFPQDAQAAPPKSSTTRYPHDVRTISPRLHAADVTSI